MIFKILCASHIVAAFMTLYCMSRKYIKQHAKMMQYIDGQLKMNAQIQVDLMQQLIGPMNGTITTIKISLDKIMQSQQGMEQVTIKALEERIDILEQKIEILKEATKKPSSQKRLNAEANS